MVKGMKPAQAVETLPFVHKRSSLVLAKVIKTTMANAAQKGVSGEDLKFKEIQINEGPKLKRFRPGSRGVAMPYSKRMSHIRIVLETVAKPKVVKGETKAKKLDDKKPEGTSVVDKQ